MKDPISLHDARRLQSARRTIHDGRRTAALEFPAPVIQARPIRMEPERSEPRAVRGVALVEALAPFHVAQDDADAELEQTPVSPAVILLVSPRSVVDEADGTDAQAKPIVEAPLALRPEALRRVLTTLGYWAERFGGASGAIHPS